MTFIWIAIAIMFCCLCVIYMTIARVMVVMYELHEKISIILGYVEVVDINVRQKVKTHLDDAKYEIPVDKKIH